MRICGNPKCRRPLNGVPAAYCDADCRRAALGALEERLGVVTFDQVGDIDEASGGDASFTTGPRFR